MTTTTITPRFVQVLTQIRENYGAHDWDGVVDCPQHWKNKGGSTYVLSEEVDVVKFTKAIERFDDYFQEFVVDMEETTDPYANMEEWETPVMVSPSPDGGFFMEVVEDGEYSCFRRGIKGKKTVGEIDPKGKQISYNVEFFMEDGQTLDQVGLDEYFKLANSDVLPRQSSRK